MKVKRTIDTIVSHVLLAVLSIIWIMPILWVVLTSFRAEAGSFTPYFWPKGFTINNYIDLFTDRQFYFGKWFMNTFFVAVCSCAISTIFTLSTAYCLSRLRFKLRKPFMNLALVLGMFPGFMSMIAVYYILKGLGISQSLAALILVYSGGAGLGFYILKGFFDTIPKTLDESAMLDGATKFQVFYKIVLPLSKPMITYTALTSFMGPWVDYIFASVIMGDNYDNYTVAIGLAKMLDREFINYYYTKFAAGSVLVSIPIALIFVVMQRFYVGGVADGAVKG